MKLGKNNNIVTTKFKYLKLSKVLEVAKMYSSVALFESLRRNEHKYANETSPELSVQKI